jgi:hypothetical protein
VAEVSAAGFWANATAAVKRSKTNRLFIFRRVYNEVCVFLR